MKKNLTLIIILLVGTFTGYTGCLSIIEDVIIEKSKEKQEDFIKKAEQERIAREQEEELKMTNQERIEKQFSKFHSAMLSYSYSHKTEYYKGDPCPNAIKDLIEKDEDKVIRNDFDPYKKDPWGNDYFYKFKQFDEEDIFADNDRKLCIFVKLLDGSTDEECVRCESAEHAIKNKDRIDNKLAENKRKYGDDPDTASIQLNNNQKPDEIIPVVPANPERSIQRHLDNFESAVKTYARNNRSNRMIIGNERPASKHLCPESVHDLKDVDQFHNDKQFDASKKDPWGNDYIYAFKDLDVEDYSDYDKEFCVSTKLDDGTVKEKCVRCETLEHAAQNENSKVKSPSSKRNIPSKSTRKNDLRIGDSSIRIPF